jgi:transcriptional regulator with XRE-family HTH domain
MGTVIKLNSKRKRGSAPTKRTYVHPIDQLLAKRGQTRRWLAEQCGVSQTYIGMICRGERRLDTNDRNLFLIRLKKALQADLNDLVLGPKD